jgi:chromosome segregation ATPase
MIKNQHLLGGLVVLGTVNLLAVFGLISGESSSARAIKGLEHDFAKARDEDKKGLDALLEDNRELRRGLEQSAGTISQLREELDGFQARLSRTRKALEAAEERLDKIAPRPAEGKEGGQ